MARLFLKAVMDRCHQIPYSADGTNVLDFIQNNNKLDINYLFIMEKIHIPDTHLLLKLITEYDSLKILMLYYIDIGLSGMTLFSNALQHNSTLTSLSLTGFIGDDGLKELGLALSKNERLSLFAIQDKTITHSGAALFSNTIKNNKTLRYISFGNNYNIEKNIHDSIKSIAIRNTLLWHNTYWKPYLHTEFNCHKMVMTTLLCNDEKHDNNNEYRLKLPMLVWIYIFSFWQYKMF